LQQYTDRVKVTLLKQD